MKSPHLSVEMALGVRLILTSNVSAHPVDNSGVIVINRDGDVFSFLSISSSNFFWKLFQVVLHLHNAPTITR